MEIVLAGASGLIGSALKTALRDDGHTVRALVRRPSSGPDEIRWDPGHGELDASALAGAGAVICLSGVGVADHRWTESYKEQIVTSRVDSVETIARTLAEHGGPRVFLAASAVGYYGDTGDREIEESAPPGDSFLSDVCTQWEAAAEPARAAGVRVTHLRTGLVLSRRGGLLKQLLPLVKAGLGGPVGSGRQFMPWISLRDETAAIRFLLEHELAGPVNLASPHPATNAEFTRTLGRVVHRPTVLRVPGFALRVALGEVAGDILTGQRAIPHRLTEAGFRFADPELEPMLRAELR